MSSEVADYDGDVTAVLERVTDGFFALNTDWEFTYVNEQAEELVGRAEAELLGTSVWDAFPDAVDSTFDEQYHHAMEAQESVTFEAAFEPLDAYFEVRAYPSETGLSVYFRDVSDRHEREQRLEQHRATLEAIGDGAYALDADRRYVFVNEAFVEMSGYDREELLGERPSRLFDETAMAEIVDHVEQLRADEREIGVVEAKLHPADGDPFWTETRFRLRPGPESFTGTVGIVRDISDRRRRQRRLENHRDKLLALVDRTEVVQDVNRRIASASTPEAVESTVCQTLVESEFYEVAWIGDSHEGQLHSHAGAGRPDTALQALVDAAREAGEAGSVETALRRQTIHVTQNVDGDGPDSRSVALAEHGLHSSISLPLVHDGESFGVLVISSTESHAFSGTERDLLSSLADTIAYALHAVEDRERYRTVVTDVLDSAIDAGVVIVDADDQVAWSNERAGTFFGYDPDDVAGRSRSAFVETCLLPAVEDPTHVAVNRPQECGAVSGADELHVVAEGDRTERYVERRRTPVESGLYEGGCVELFYDITARKQSARALAESERLRRTLMGNLPGMVYQCRDEEGWPMSFVSEGCRDLTGHAPSAFETGDLSWGSDIVHEDDRESVRETIDTHAVDESTFELTYRITRADGEQRWVWEIGQHVETTDGEQRLEGFITDITDRKRQEQQLERQHRLRTQILETSPVGILVVDEDDDAQMLANDRAREMLSSFGYTFESDGIHVEDLEHEDGTIEFRDEDGEPLPGDRHPITAVLETGESVSDVTIEVRLSAETSRWVAASAAPIDDDSVVAVFEDVTARRERKQSLERLNHLNAVIRRINQSLVSAPDRETIQETVCEELAATDQYAAAWYAEVDLASDELEAVAGSGIDLDGLPATSASAEDTFASRAVRSGSVSVGGVESAAQRELLGRTDCPVETAAIAAVPVAYANAKYGVLCVAAPDESAFSADVVEVFEELGETIGHALNAHLRREGLVSDTATRLEFRLRKFPSPQLELSEESALGTPEFTFEETVPRGDGTVLQYVTTRDVSTDSFLELAEAVPTIDNVKEISSSEETTRYELRQTNPPLVEMLATHGGRVVSVSVEDGDLHVVAELPDSAEVRELVEQVFDEFPGADLEAQRSVQRSASTPIQLREEILTGLTERQRTTLEVAYLAGYFEWPRESTGEEVADSLDVSQSTFSQHLRAGERKTFDLLFGSDLDETASKE